MNPEMNTSAVAEQQILAIVPALSNCKGLPGKNIRWLAGKPLLGWIIEAAKRSRLITRVICATDSAYYAELARRYGAETPFLIPSEMASEDVAEDQVVRYAVQWLADNEKYQPDIVVRLEPANPTFPTSLIDAGIEKLRHDPTADSVLAVRSARGQPQAMLRLNPENETLEPFSSASAADTQAGNGENRQDPQAAYIPVGAMEVLRYRTATDMHRVAGRQIRPLEIEDELLTIRTEKELDFRLADFAIHSLGMSQ